MNKRIQCDVAIGHNKVVAIKQMRMATGWGLKQAKDAVDAIAAKVALCTNPAKVIFTSEQYGNLIVAGSMDIDNGYDQAIFTSNPVFVEDNVMDLTQPLLCEAPRAGAMVDPDKYN